MVVANPRYRWLDHISDVNTFKDFINPLAERPEAKTILQINVGIQTMCL